jgi:hypothetical protein
LKLLALGAALGGLAAYLYDPELGEIRRGRLSSLWDENRNAVLRAGRDASETVESARPVARRLTKAIGSAKWPSRIARGRSAVSWPTLMGAAVVGGALVYFMDPVNGPARRLQVLGTSRKAVDRVANMVRPAGAHIGDQVTNAVERIKSRVS